MSDFKFPPPPPPPPKAASTTPDEAQRGGSRGFRGGRGRGGRGAGRQWHGSNSRGGAYGRGNYRGQHEYSGQNPHKRKREDDHDGASFAGRHTTNVQPKPKPVSRPKVEVAPAVPSFGAPLSFLNPPTATSPAQAKSAETSASPAPKTKSKTNPLGLTPKGEDPEESEDDAGEEAAALAAYTGKYANSPPQLPKPVRGLTSDSVRVEYRGRVWILNSPEEVASWIEERRKKWPTAARVTAKKLEAQKRREEHEAARKKEAESRQLKSRVSKGGMKEEKKKKNRGSAEKSVEDQKKSIEKHLAKAEKLRKKLEEMESKTNDAKQDAGSVAAPHDEAEKPEVGHPTPGVAVGEASNNFQQVEVQPPSSSQAKMSIAQTLGYSDSSDAATGHSSSSSSSSTSSPEPAPKLIAATGSDPDTDSSSSPSSSSDDDDADDKDPASSSTPEKATAKSSAPVRLPPPPRADPPPNKKPCRYFAARGSCRHADRCKYSHDVSAAPQQRGRRGGREQAPGRMSLSQRLMERQRERENVALLAAIKELGDEGLLD